MKPRVSHRRLTPLAPAPSAVLARPLRGIAAAAAPLALLIAAPGAAAQGQTNPFGLANAGTGAVRPAFGDLNGDGTSDLLACSPTGAAFSFYPNTGSATAPAFGAAQASPFGLGACDGSPIALVDLNSDGLLDIVSGRSDGGFDYYANTGTAAVPTFGTPQNNPFGLTNVSSGNSAPAFADLDGDGDFDLISGSKVDTLYYYENTGGATPTFVPPANDPFGANTLQPGAYSKPALGDADGDGLVDVLVAREDGQIALYRNIGTASVPAYDPSAAQTPPGGVTAQPPNSSPSPAFVNLDGGTPDVFIGLSSGDFVFFSNPTLPVELVAFTAAADGDRAVLRWETASETANSGFAVERLTSDGAFADGAERLGFVAGHGTTSEAHRYTFRTERLAAGAHRFRLRQIDTDGTATLSPTVEVRVGTEGAFALTDAAPSPTRGASRLTLSVARAQAVTVAVYDALGRRVTTLHDGPMGDGEARTFEIDTRAWASGTYHVVATGERFRADRRLVVVR